MVPECPCHNQYVNIRHDVNIRHAIREEATLDVDQVASTLVATSDPAAARELSELVQDANVLLQSTRGGFWPLRHNSFLLDRRAAPLRVALFGQIAKCVIACDAAEPVPQGGFAA